MKNNPTPKTLFSLFLLFYVFLVGIIIKHTIDVKDMVERQELDRYIAQENHKKYEEFLNSLIDKLDVEELNCDNMGICVESPPKEDLPRPAKLPDKLFLIHT